MQALKLTDYGAAPQVGTMDTAHPREGQVRINIAGATLNPLDIKIQAGWMKEFFPVDFPYLIGTDLSGTIDALGAGVVDWRVGDRIIARLDPVTGGAIADSIVVPADQLVRAPPRSRSPMRPALS